MEKLSEIEEEYLRLHKIKESEQLEMQSRVNNLQILGYNPSEISVMLQADSDTNMTLGNSVTEEVKEHLIISKKDETKKTQKTLIKPDKPQPVIEIRDPKGKIDPNKLGTYYLNLESTRFVKFPSDKELYFYSNGIYKPHAKDVLAHKIELLTKGDVNSYQVSETINHIVRHCLIYDKSMFDNPDPNIIHMGNGLYNIKKHTLEPYNKDYFSFHQGNVHYDPDAKCPNIDNFIREIVNEKDISIIYEMIGYTLMNERKNKIAFILEGKPNSGKSVLLKLIRAMIGSHNITNVDPANVSNTKFGSVEFYGKKVNIVDDLGTTPFLDTGILKSVIAGEIIFGQNKGEKGFNFEPKVVCIFATNNLPSPETFDAAFASRFSIIDFPNSFEGKTADVNIFKKLSTKNELSGLFNKSIKAYESIKNGEFTNAGSLSDRIRKYKHTSNSISKFVDEICDLSKSTVWIAKDELYHIYVNWCRDFDKPPEELGKLTKYLKEQGVTVKKKMIRGDSFGIYSGIEILGTNIVSEMSFKNPEFNESEW